MPREDMGGKVGVTINASLFEECNKGYVVGTSHTPIMSIQEIVHSHICDTLP